eukprot:CAMPEP_0172680942 /NCGR_PEP_ID=MMETSP1074-20121228/17112_1 /TAXON_ID=2916 /ORGANISM="Ceratium fusus, Strain PA161109" /LENGTH=60 /DNA_ID=CAMNT_0013499359 /DNA_START=77 /DNA_END=259 /DNA_ORIENTATION=+
MKEQAKKTLEEQIGNAAPGSIKCCFPCCGGPVGTIEKMGFMIPADQKDMVMDLIKKYKDM